MMIIQKSENTDLYIQTIINGIIHYVSEIHSAKQFESQDEINLFLTECDVPVTEFNFLSFKEDDKNYIQFDNVEFEFNSPELIFEPPDYNNTPQNYEFDEIN